MNKHISEYHAHHHHHHHEHSVEAYSLYKAFKLGIALLKDKEKDLNVKGAFLHMLADTLVSVGVVVAGIIIRFTGWYFIDPIISIVIAILIAWSTWVLLAESFRLSIYSVPSDIDIRSLEKEICEVPGVMSIHHLHVCALSKTENAMTVLTILEFNDCLY